MKVCVAYVYRRYFLSLQLNTFDSVIMPRSGYRFKIVNNNSAGLGSVRGRIYYITV